VCPHVYPMKFKTGVSYLIQPLERRLLRNIIQANPKEKNRLTYTGKSNVMMQGKEQTDCLYTHREIQCGYNTHRQVQCLVFPTHTGKSNEGGDYAFVKREILHTQGNPTGSIQIGILSGSHR